MRYGRFGSSREKGGGLALVLGAGFALLVIGYVGYFFGKLIQASLSRQREYLADASAVQFTRNPGGVTGPLKKNRRLRRSAPRSRPTARRRSVISSSPRPTRRASGASGPPIRRSGRASGRSSPDLTGSTSSRRTWSTSRRTPGPRCRTCPSPRPAPSPLAAAAFGAAIAAAAGTLSPEGAADAQAILAQIPAALREAAPLAA